jgi:peptide/nickel transport system substrate-binding protein
VAAVRGLADVESALRVAVRETVMSVIDVYVEQVRKRRISRREFVNRLLLLGISVPTINAILTAYSPAAATAAPASAVRRTSTAHAAVAAQQGGVLRVSFTTDPVGLDPALSGTYATNLVTELVYAGLVQYDKQMNIVPDMAESVEISEDHLTYTFKLRQGILFHNGQEMTSDDVKFTIERVRDPETGAFSKFRVDPVESIETPDKYTVILNLNAVTSTLLASLASPYLAIEPRAEVEKLGDLMSTMIGTGPFKFVSYEPKKLMVLERNPDYYVEGQPYLDRLEIQFIEDDTTRINALRTGAIDFVQSVPFKLVKGLETAPGIVLATPVETCRWSFIGYNNKRPPFDNPLVRRALSHAMNREGSVQAGYFGYAKPITGGPIPPWSWAYTDQEYFSPTPNVEEAKKLLAQAGFPDGFKTTIKTSGVYSENLAEAIVNKEAFKAIGVDCEVIQLDWASLANDWDVAKDYDMASLAWGGPLVDPDDYLYAQFHSTGGWNAVQFADPEVDKLLDATRRTFDQEERKQLYADVSLKLCELSPEGFSVLGDLIHAMSDKVQGFHPTYSGMTKWLRETTIEA